MNHRHWIASILLCLVSASVAHAQALTADQVVDRYIEGMGGARALAAIQSRETEGEVKMGWVTIKTHSRLERPNHFVDSMKMLGVFVGDNGYDGKRAWARKRSDVKQVEGDDFKRAIRGHSLDWNLQFRNWYPNIRLLPDSEVDGTPVHSIEAIADNKDREVWRFDAETGLLRQMEGMVKDDDGKMVPAVFKLSDYRKVDGIMLPFRAEGSSNGKSMVSTMTSIVQNQKIEAIVFPETK